jgi:outer membrane immunogenic protein
MKKYFLTVALAAVCTAAFSAGAFAADLPVKGTPFASAYDPWTGCYLGGNTGSARFDVHTVDVGNADFGSSSGSGWSYGGQIGCDARFQNLVVGIRGMWDGASASADKALGPINLGNFLTETQHIRLQEFGTLDARIGFLASPTFMIYGVGGAAWSDFRTLYNPAPGIKWTADHTSTGYNVGIGSSWLFAPNWELWVEYDHLQFGNDGVTAKFTGAGVVNDAALTQKPRVDTVLVGLNYRFSFTR